MFLGLAEPPTEWLPRADSAEIKRPGHEADKSPSCSAETNSEWTLTSNPNMPSWSTQREFYWLLKIHRPRHFILKRGRLPSLLLLSAAVMGGRECPQLARIYGALTPRPTCSSLVPQLLSLRS